MSDFWSQYAQTTAMAQLTETVKELAERVALLESAAQRTGGTADAQRATDGAPKLTREQFIAQYAAWSGMSRESLLKYREPVPCDCGETSCQGWAMVPLPHSLPGGIEPCAR